MKNKELEILNLGINGEGVAKEDSKIFFVPFALPNEKVEVEIVKERENLAFCNLKKIIKKSNKRVEPKCKFFYKCGGCNLEHFDYLESLNFKKNLVRETIKKIAGIDAEVLDVIESKNYHYRNKMVFPIARIDGKNIVGMFKEKTHFVVEISECKIAESSINRALKIFKKFIQDLKLEGYFQNEKNGVLKYFVCRILDGVPCVVLVAKKDISNSIKNLEEYFKKEFEKYSIWLNINNKKTSEIFSDNFKFIAGKKEIDLIEFDIKHSVHPYSFMQVNNEIKEKLYHEILNNVSKDSTILEGYSGAGLLTAILSRKAKFVYGIEINKSATKDANLLKFNNNIGNIVNINGDSAIKLPEILKTNNDLTVVVDPPKAGLDKKLIDSLNENVVKKIIYIACGLTTLARDLKLLKENYSIKKIQPFDMFPNTNHVETLVVLERNVGVKK